MKITLSTVITLLVMLFLFRSVWANEGKPSDNGKAPTANSTEQAERHDTDIKIKVQNDGEQITVDATFTVPVLPPQAWAVLTDFDNIPNFISSIQSSRVIDRSGNSVQVSQSGMEKYGFVTVSLESVRKVYLSPFKKIQERMISGSMRKMEETTQLSPEGDHTRIIYHADIIPGIWLLRIIGPVFIENEARKQFQEIINEIIRRKRLIISSG
ncbi:MAG: SRPBCC family protein [Nitrosospira sp.]|nr:SRPBCC family protein [Nitrosospira sp.]